MVHGNTRHGQCGSSGETRSLTYPSRVAVVPLTQDAAAAFVRRHHRHHKPDVGDYFRVGLLLGGELVAVAVVGRPKAAAFGRLVFEVTRLASAAPVQVNACSRLYSACARAAFAMGYRRGVTYTRADEPGTSLRAAGWWPTARVPGREWTTGNKALRWLPGLYEPSTEIVDRVRWECGPDADAEDKELAHVGRRVHRQPAGPGEVGR